MDAPVSLAVRARRQHVFHSLSGQIDQSPSWVFCISGPCCGRWYHVICLLYCSLFDHCACMLFFFNNQSCMQHFAWSFWNILSLGFQAFRTPGYSKSRRFVYHTINEYNKPKYFFSFSTSVLDIRGIYLWCGMARYICMIMICKNAVLNLLVMKVTLKLFQMNTSSDSA